MEDRKVAEIHQAMEGPKVAGARKVAGASEERLRARTCVALLKATRVRALGRG